MVVPLPAHDKGIPSPGSVQMKGQPPASCGFGHGPQSVHAPNRTTSFVAGIFNSDKGSAGVVAVAGIDVRKTLLHIKPSSVPVEQAHGST